MKQKLFFETNDENNKPDEIDKVKRENTNYQCKELKGCIIIISKDIKRS